MVFLLQRLADFQRKIDRRSLENTNNKMMEEFKVHVYSNPEVDFNFLGVGGGEGERGQATGTVDTNDYFHLDTHSDSVFKQAKVLGYQVDGFDKFCPLIVYF